MIILNQDKELYVNITGNFSSDYADYIVQYLEVSDNCSISELQQIEGNDILIGLSRIIRKLRIYKT